MKRRRHLTPAQRVDRIARLNRDLRALREQDGPLVQRAFLSREIEHEEAELRRGAS